MRVLTLPIFMAFMVWLLYVLAKPRKPKER
jgi:hypothetical protein